MKVLIRNGTMLYFVGNIEIGLYLFTSFIIEKLLLYDCCALFTLLKIIKIPLSYMKYYMSLT